MTITQERERVGREPDYQFSMANDRTFLSWVRTTLGLLAAAAAVAQIVHTTHNRIGALISVTLAALAVIVAVTAYRDYRSRQQKMRLHRPLPHSRLPLIMVVTMVFVASMVLYMIGTGDFG